MLVNREFWVLVSWEVWLGTWIVAEMRYIKG